jgi:hypothetical protein
MKTTATYLCLSVLSVAALSGCGGGDKKTDGSGPRITGGAPVDSKAKPERPSLGGEATSPKE